MKPIGLIKRLVPLSFAFYYYWVAFFHCCLDFIAQFLYNIFSTFFLFLFYYSGEHFFPCSKFKSIRKNVGNVEKKYIEIIFENIFFRIESTLGNIHFCTECNDHWMQFMVLPLLLLLLPLFSTTIIVSNLQTFYLHGMKNGASCGELQNKHLSKFIICTLFVCVWVGGHNQLDVPYPKRDRMNGKWAEIWMHWKECDK